MPSYVCENGTKTSCTGPVSFSSQKEEGQTLSIFNAKRLKFQSLAFKMLALVSGKHLKKERMTWMLVADSTRHQGHWQPHPRLGSQCGTPLCLSPVLRMTLLVKPLRMNTVSQALLSTLCLKGLHSPSHGSLGRYPMASGDGAFCGDARGSIV